MGYVERSRIRCPRGDERCMPGHLKKCPFYHGGDDDDGKLGGQIVDESCKMAISEGAKALVRDMEETGTIRSPQHREEEGTSQFPADLIKQEDILSRPQYPDGKEPALPQQEREEAEWLVDADETKVDQKPPMKQQRQLPPPHPMETEEEEERWADIGLEDNDQPASGYQGGLHRPSNH